MASPSKARAITNRRDSAIRRDSLKLFVAAAERKVQRRDSQAPIFSSPKNGASDLECFDSDAHDVVHVDNVQEIRGSEVTAFETHYKFRHTRSLSIIKYNDSTNDQAVRTNRCSGISTRYRLQTKSIMWAAAAASASIYSMDPVSLIGNYRKKALFLPNIVLKCRTVCTEIEAKSKKQNTTSSKGGIVNAARIILPVTE